MTQTALLEIGPNLQKRLGLCRSGRGGYSLDPAVYEMSGFACLFFDPGVAPAAALYCGPGQLIRVWAPMGITQTVTKQAAITRSGKVLPRREGEKTEMDSAAVVSAILESQPHLVGIEKVGPSPGAGVTSMFRFGAAWGEIKGIVRGIAAGRSAPRLTEVNPQEWRRAWRLSQGKEQSRIVVQRVFPAIALQFEKKKTHNEADALLGAAYIWHRETGIPLPL